MGDTRASGPLRTRIIPGIVDAQGNPLPMPYDHARWHDDWYPQVLAHRARALRATAGTDRASLAARSAHKALCRQPGGDGRLYLLNTFGWVLEPRNDAGVKRIPFITWPRQTELIDEEEAAKATPGPSPDANLAVIKSRDVSGTWIDVTDSIDGWLWVEDYHALIISSTFEQAADWDDVKSYFFKIKFLMQSVPEWLWPPGFAGFVPRSPHAKEGILINPANGSTISASTTTPDAGRGDRRAKVTLEEAGEQDDFDAKYNNLQNVTNHVKVVSSAHIRHGMGLKNLIHGEDGYTAPRIFYFRWSDVPGRDETWYRNKKATMKDDEFAREIEINWLSGSGEFAYPQVAHVEAGHFPFVPGWPTRVIIDDGYDQHFAITWLQKDLTHRRYRVIASYKNRHQPIRYYGFLMLGQPTTEFAWGQTELDLMGWIREFGVFNALYYGDRHGDNTDLSSGKSPFGVLAEEFGIGVVTATDPERNDVKYRRDALATLLPHFDFDLGHGAPEVLDGLKYTRFPKRRDSAQPTTETKDVIHGNERHQVVTLEYFAINERHEFSGFDAPSGPVPRVAIGGGFDPHRGRRHNRAEEVAWTR